MFNYKTKRHSIKKRMAFRFIPFIIVNLINGKSSRDKTVKRKIFQH